MPCGVTFGERTCQDPKALRDSFLQASPPPPVDWFGMANRYATTTCLAPGYGHVLLLGSDLDALDLAGNHALQFTDSITGTRVGFPNIRVVGEPKCLDFGHRDPVYLVELSDRRIDAVGMIGRRYNWRRHASAAMEPESLRPDGSSWSWESLLENLWGSVGCLGTWPGLPDGAPSLTSPNPRQIDSHGHRAVDVLEDCLAVNGMAVNYDLVNDEFKIVYLAEDDTQLRLVLDKHTRNHRRVWDDQPYEQSRPATPAHVRVLFPVWLTPGTADLDERQHYAVDVEDPLQLEFRRKGTIGVIQDYYPARVYGSTAIDPDLLTTRAARVARVYFDRLGSRIATSAIRKAFSGYLSDPEFVNGKFLDAVCWGDTGDGPVTLVARSGRSGMAELRSISDSQIDKDGQILTSFAPTAYSRAGSSQDQKAPILRAGALPAAPRRYREATGWSAGGPDMGPIAVAGAGLGPLLRRASAIRQGEWDTIGTGGFGDPRARLWRQRIDLPNDYETGFGRIMSLSTVEGKYPALRKLQIGAPSEWPDGERCWIQPMGDEVLDMSIFYPIRRDEVPFLGRDVWTTMCCTGPVAGSGSGSGGSGGGSGGGGGASGESCCTGQTPSQVCLGIGGVGAGCPSCFTQTIVLFYVAGAAAWIGTASCVDGDCTYTFNATLQCHSCSNPPEDPDCEDLDCEEADFYYCLKWSMSSSGLGCVSAKSGTVSWSSSEIDCEDFHLPAKAIALGFPNCAPVAAICKPEECEGCGVNTRNVTCCPENYQLPSQIFLTLSGGEGTVLLTYVPDCDLNPNTPNPFGLGCWKGFTTLSCGQDIWFEFNGTCSLATSCVSITGPWVSCNCTQTSCPPDPFTTTCEIVYDVVNCTVCTPALTGVVTIE